MQHCSTIDVARDIAAMRVNTDESLDAIFHEQCFGVTLDETKPKFSHCLT